MTRSEVTEKIANNVLLVAVSRLVMAIGVPAALAISGWYLTSTGTAISDVQSKVSSVTDRVTVLEVQQRNGADRGTQFQTDTKVALAKLQDQQTAILEELAALNATLKGQIER